MVVVLAGLAWSRRPSGLIKGSIIYAIALNVFALIIVLKVLTRLQPSQSGPASGPGPSSRPTAKAS